MFFCHRLHLLTGDLRFSSVSILTADGLSGPHQHLAPFSQASMGPSRGPVEISYDKFDLSFDAVSIMAARLILAALFILNAGSFFIAPHSLAQKVS